MSLMVSLSWVRPDEYMAVMNATANKLVDIATTQTGTGADDWVVRPTMPDGGTGPASGPSGTQTPDFSISNNSARGAAAQLGWDIDISAVLGGNSWDSLIASGDSTVDDNKYYAFYGAWEDAVHASAAGSTGSTPQLPPLNDGWKFESGSSVLDIYWMQGTFISSEAVGAITKSPVIYTQNSPIKISTWVAADTRLSGGHVDVDHAMGLFGLACEKVGKVVSRPGIHGVVPLAMTTGDMYQKLQATVANELITRAVQQTNVPADQWLVRPMILDISGSEPLSSNDLSADTTLFGASANAGWFMTASAITAAWATILADTTVPDNKFYGFFGGFECPVNVDAQDALTGPVVAAWALTKGASTEAVWFAQEGTKPFAENWGFWSTQPVYYDQNDSINIYACGNSVNKGTSDGIGGLFALVCERVGENISASKVSQG